MTGSNLTFFGCAALTAGSAFLAGFGTGSLSDYRPVAKAVGSITGVNDDFNAVNCHLGSPQMEAYITYHIGNGIGFQQSCAVNGMEAVFTGQSKSLGIVFGRTQFFAHCSFVGNSPAAGGTAGFGSGGNFYTVGSSGVLADCCLPVGEIIVLDPCHDSKPIGIGHGLLHGKRCSDFIIAEITDPFRQQNTHMVGGISGGIEDQLSIGYIVLCSCRYFDCPVAIQRGIIKIVVIQHIFSIFRILYHQVNSLAVFTGSSSHRINTGCSGNHTSVFNSFASPGELCCRNHRCCIKGYTVQRQIDQITNIGGNGGNCKGDGLRGNILGILLFSAHSAFAHMAFLAGKGSVFRPIAKLMTISTVIRCFRSVYRLYCAGYEIHTFRVGMGSISQHSRSEACSYQVNVFYTVMGADCTQNSIVLLQGCVIIVALIDSRQDRNDPRLRIIVLHPQNSFRITIGK